MSGLNSGHNSTTLFGQRGFLVSVAQPMLDHHNHALGRLGHRKGMSVVVAWLALALLDEVILFVVLHWFWVAHSQYSLTKI